MAQNELQIVTYEQAKRLKVAGFDWETDKYYDHEFYFEAPFDNHNDSQCFFSAPTVALALKGFRDVKGYVYSMDVGVSLAYKTSYHPIWSNRNMIEMDSDFKRCGRFAILEEAESALLDAFLTELEGEQCSGK